MAESHLASSSASVPPCLRGESSVLSKLSVFAADIKISHTVFALPWAVLSTFLAARETGRPITLTKVLLIVGCMVTARTVAMAANRLLDADLDKLNPRTARRAVPSGQLSRGFYRLILIVSAALFVLLTAGFWVFAGNA